MWIPFFARKLTQELSAAYVMAVIIEWSLFAFV